MKTKMQRKVFSRMVENGETFDHSAEPIYREHVEAMVAAYAKAGTLKAVKRAFGI